MRTPEEIAQAEWWKVEGSRTLSPAELIRLVVQEAVEEAATIVEKRLVYTSALAQAIREHFKKAGY